MDIVTNGKIRPSEVVTAVDNMMAKMKHKGLWESLDFMITIWSKRNPQEAKQFFTEQKTLQQTRRKHASFQNKSNRMLISLPGPIHHFLNVFWYDEIESMGRQTFYRRLAERYKQFKIPEGDV